MDKLILFIFVCLSSSIYIESSDTKKPTVLISILVRNKAHTLPYFLSLLEDLDYPKNRLSLWIRSDHNEDKSIEILKLWLNTVQEKYHSINSMLDETSPFKFDDEKEPTVWSSSRFNHIISLREQALNYARNLWADYIFLIDSDVFLTNPNTLKSLVSTDYTAVAPMLKSDGLYSNFWCGMTEEYYYHRTDDYKPILNRERIGCFSVPMIHSAVLINLHKTDSDKLTFVPDNIVNYDGPKDDIITFSISANKSNIHLYVCNDNLYGYVMVPLEQGDKLEHDFLQFDNLKLEVLSTTEPLYFKDLFKKYVSIPQKDTMGFDKIYMINLVRRPERRRRMDQCFDILGIKGTTIDAVDGRTLNDSKLKEWGIKFMPEYADPYHKRPMTLGEIGCFLSHYLIWKQVVDNGYNAVMVLEDDIRFEPFFRLKIEHLMNDVKQLSDWDLVYLGRKRLHEADEMRVSRWLVRAGYSYWTLGYILSGQGARKLLNARPLENMVPVDEYLPILFDQHPRSAWKGHFPQRDLLAFSAIPLLLYPTHYTGERGYVSDTEDSSLIPPSLISQSSPNHEEL